jgi:hypothetical protein
VLLILRRVPQKVSKVFRHRDRIQDAASSWAAVQLLQIAGTRRLELLTSTVSNLDPESDGATPEERE